MPTENGLSRHRLLETRLNYEPTHTAYTHCMDVQQVSLSGNAAAAAAAAANVAADAAPAEDDDDYDYDAKAIMK